MNGFSCNPVNKYPLKVSLLWFWGSKTFLSRFSYSGSCRVKSFVNYSKCGRRRMKAPASALALLKAVVIAQDGAFRFTFPVF